MPGPGTGTTQFHFDPHFDPPSSFIISSLHSIDSYPKAYIFQGLKAVVGMAFEWDDTRINEINEKIPSRASATFGNQANR